MHIVKKINRGVILTFFVILGVVIYLIAHDVNQKKQIPELKRISQEFVEQYTKQLVTPEKFLGKDVEISNEDIKGYAENTKKLFDAYYPEPEKKDESIDISKAYLSNDFINVTADSLIQNFNSNVKLKRKVLSFDKKITSFRTKFKDNSATATILVENKVEVMNADGKKDTLTSTSEDSVSFLKVNGQWKVIYSLISDTNNDNGMAMNDSGNVTIKGARY